MKRDWLWDKNINEQEVKAVLSNVEGQKFISYAALLLSRNNSAQEVFKDLISKENFFVAWGKIKRQMRKNAWNDPRIEYWQAIYDTLKEEKPELKELKEPRFEESVFSISREIGSKVKFLREEAGLKQKDLAKKLGISQQIISRVESGRQNVSIETLSSICEALGFSLDAEKLGFKVCSEKPETTATHHILSFNRLSPDDFERMCYWIIEGLKIFDEVEHYGGMGDKQRDIIAYKCNSVGQKEKWYFQCKRYKKIEYKTFEEELEKIKKHSDGDPQYNPDKIVFVAACSVPSGIKDKVKECAKSLDLNEVAFWTDIELDEKAKATGADKEFFDVGIKKDDLKKMTENINKNTTSLPSEAGLLTEKSASKKDEINKTIDEAVNEIHRNKIEKAKQILLNVKGKIEDNLDQYKEELVRVYNNLGVCYNRFESDGGDFDEAEKYFQLAIERDPVFIRARINLASVYLNRGGQQNFQKAYNLSSVLWNESDKNDPIIFSVFIWSKFHSQSPQEAIDYYEKSLEAQSLVRQDDKLLNLMGTIYAGKGNCEKAQEFADQALILAPNTPCNFMLKARALLDKAQTEDIVRNAFDVISKFKKADNIKDAASCLNEALEILEKEKKEKNQRNEFLESQIKYDLSICLIWLRKFEDPDYKNVRESIDSKWLDPIQKEGLNIHDVLLEIQKRNFETAYFMLIHSAAWFELPYKEKVRLAHIFFLRGAPEQSKNIFLGIEQEAEQKKDMWLYIDMSLNAVLLNNKNMAVAYAEKVKQLGKELSKEKIALSHYNAIMRRYADDNEADRLMAGMFEYDKKFPENKAVWAVKAIEEDGSVSEEFKSMLLKQKKWYEDIKEKFRNEPMPTYFLEQILKRTYAEILSFRFSNELDFTFELTLPDKTFEEHLINNFEKAEKLVFDYASLLNLSKMNLLGYLEKLGKEIFITKKLFDKIQLELLQVEQEDLRNLWRFLRDSKALHILDDVEISADGKYDILRRDHDWLIDSLYWAKNKQAVFVVDDFRLLNFFKSEENVGCCNSFIILKNLLKKGWIDKKIYAASVGDLAERFYTFLPFSGEDLFYIVMEDKSKLSLRSLHLVNELFLPGSIIVSFTAVFVKFIDLLWETGSLPEDKVEWLCFLSKKITECIERQIGMGNKQELEQIVSDFARMWIIAIQRSGKDEILLLEKRAGEVFENPAHKVFKETVLRFIKEKKISLRIN
ncbi:MAG: helix-turn-helix domain-containing protein [Candidatus Omnitrophota bacterium]